MDQRSIGLLVVALGTAAIVIGGLIAVGALGWFGRLPGDFHIENGNMRVYAPIASMLIISAVLSLLLWVVGRFS